MKGQSLVHVRHGHGHFLKSLRFFSYKNHNFFATCLFCEINSKTLATKFCFIMHLCIKIFTYIYEALPLKMVANYFVWEQFSGLTSVSSNILTWYLEEKDSNSSFFQLLIGSQLMCSVLANL